MEDKSDIGRKRLLCEFGYKKFSSSEEYDKYSSFVFRFMKDTCCDEIPTIEEINESQKLLFYKVLEEKEYEYIMKVITINYNEITNRTDIEINYNTSISKCPLGEYSSHINSPYFGIKLPEDFFYSNLDKLEAIKNLL